VYLSQNDGTLMSVDYAERYPVATFASGPTNSMRGAAFLSGILDCAVVDIGGTTSDVGVLQHGFPREASIAVEIGGVRTNFRMPDVFSFGLGGGSLVRKDGELTIGPDSVGYELTERALVFGGSELTTTDIAVAAGLADIGDAGRVASLDRSLVERARSVIETEIAESVDRMKTSAGDIPVVVVGGGSVLLGDTLAGASQLVKPEHFAVANAIGAAIAQVGGEVDRVFSLEQLPREEALAQAKQEATDKAVAAGASRESVAIVDVEEVPLAYLPSNATRIHVKAVGELELGRETVAAG
jgi:N-methylhydantoinase A/oxoprolinase/acetone carboxylase beta subunit